MRAQGLLTDAQAQALRESLSPLGPLAPPPRRGARIAVAIVLVCAAIAALALAIGAFSLLGSDPGGEDIQRVSETINLPGGTGAMNKTVSTLTSSMLLLLPLVLVIGGFAWFYNRIVDKEERVYQAWSQVESNLQRRTDLVPNLVETVSRYLQHERETLSALTGERGNALNPLADAMNRVIEAQRSAGTGKGVSLDSEEALARLAKAQQVLGGSLRNLVAVAENYPNLRSADQFLSLQSQLEGTENRINVARMAFNESVGVYNSAIRRLPGSLVATVGDFRRKGYFEAEAGAEEAVNLGFEPN
jgi:LemA protein